MIRVFRREVPDAGLPPGGFRRKSAWILRLTRHAINLAKKLISRLDSSIGLRMLIQMTTKRHSKSAGNSEGPGKDQIKFVIRV